MKTNRSKLDGPAMRVLEPRRRPRSPALALLGLALVGLVQAGCRSDGCSTCGFGNSISNAAANSVQALGNGVRAVGSIFHHKKGCGGGGDCGCGGGGYEEGVVVDSGMPVVPGGMTYPPSMPGSGTIIPPPSIEQEPTNLKPLDGAVPTSSTGTGTGTSTATPSGGGTPPIKSSASPSSRANPSGTTRSNYTTSLPRSGSVARRGSDVAQTGHSSPAPAARSSYAGTSDLLENIPPVDLPTDVTRNAVPSPIAPKAIVAPSQGTPAPVTPPAEKVSAADGDTLDLPPIAASLPAQAPGLRRFASVAPSIAGGSAPSIEGLDWLKEKGYKTLVDLRKGSEVDPNFGDSVNDRGMVYISLPIVANRLDLSRLARFDDLLSRNENRPLFFCDTDGTRAALAWYIHRRVVGQEDPQTALSKAEELGLGVAEVKIAEDFLATHKPRAKAAMARVAMATEAPPATEVKPAAELPKIPAEGVSPPALPASPDPSNPVAKPAVAPRAVVEPTPEMLPGESKPQASSRAYDGYRDPAAWKPVAALVLTGIGVPLAFWSRSVLSDYRYVRRRASLPGARPRPLEAPASSDA